MPYTRPLWCTARHYDPDVTCELRYDHPGTWHRAEYGPPTYDPKTQKWNAQIVSWA